MWCRGSKIRATIKKQLQKTNKKDAPKIQWNYMQQNNWIKDTKGADGAEKKQMLCRRRGDKIKHRSQSSQPWPFLAFLAGQQTNSTPEKTSMPQGRSIAKLRSRIDRSEQARPAVPFHWSKFQHLVWLCMWSKRQCSGTRRASDWKGPSAGRVLVEVFC